MKIRNIDFKAKASVFLLIAAGTLFQSCQQDGGEEWTDGEDELVPIEVQAGITGDVVATRATYEDLPDNSTIGIFCMNANNYDLVEDVKYTKNASGAWLPADESKVIYVGAETAKLCAYYCPSGVTFNEDGRGATYVTMKPQPYEGNDLCYATKATADVWKGSPQAGFNMKHAYARMTFILIRDLGYVGDCKVTNLCLDTNGGAKQLQSVRYLDISKGNSSFLPEEVTTLKWDMTSHAGWSDLANNGIPASDTENSKNIDLLLIPQQIDGINLKVQLTVDGNVLSVVLGTTFTISVGRCCIITLKLKNTSLELGSVETQNWTDVTVGSGDYEIK